MRIIWAELRDFRNHRRSRVEDVPQALVLVAGPNGEGKTNLLEGLAFLSFLGSPRASSTEPVVRKGAEVGYVRGEVHTEGGRMLVEIEIPAHGASRARVNRSPIRRRRDLRRQVRAVFFAPEDLAIVLGDPGERRAFLDEAARALWPLKEGVITAYERALRQRNRLLREWDGRGVPAGLEVWDAELARTGSALTRLRAAAVAALAPAAEEEYRHITGHGLEVSYAPSVQGEPVEAVFAARLRERRGDELARRTTLVGPHRDDLRLDVRELEARSFASHGESWAAALCLRLGLATAVAAEIGEAPILLLDDPFSALDPTRRRRLVERLRGRGQAFVSAADPEHVPDGVAAVWWVRAGAVSVEGEA